MAWTKTMPRQEGRFWVKLPEFSFLVLGDIYSVNDRFDVYIGGRRYSEDIKALFWDEPVIEPPMPE